MTFICETAYSRQHRASPLVALSQTIEDTKSIDSSVRHMTVHHTRDDRKRFTRFCRKKIIDVLAFKSVACSRL